MIAIIDYGVGNLGSIANMLSRIGTEAIITSEKQDIEKAEKIILPGVGAFDNGIRSINERGLMPILTKKVLNEKTPLLGICLGMQLLTRKSEEGKFNGFGWFDADTKKFKFNKDDNLLRVPHMGWNTIRIIQDDPLFKNLPQDARFYFVHSYHVICDNDRDILAKTHYGYDFASIIRKENIVGVQFHPEKSHKFGMQILKNFAEA